MPHGLHSASQTPKKRGLLLLDVCARLFLGLELSCPVAQAQYSLPEAISLIYHYQDGSTRSANFAVADMLAEYLAQIRLSAAATKSAQQKTQGRRLTTDPPNRFCRIDSHRCSFSNDATIKPTQQRGPGGFAYSV